MAIGYAGALIGGLLSILSPCSVMLLPAFFAYAFSSPTKLLGRTVLFYAGLVATLVPLGVLASVLGSLVIEYRDVLIGVAAAVVIIIGVVQLIGVTLPGFSRGAAGEGTSAVSVFVLGAVYGVAGVCAGPILGSILTIAAVGGNPAYGGILLAIYALGMVVPLGLLALVWTRLRLAERPWMKPRYLRIGSWKNSWWMIASGLLSVAIGLLLLLTEGTAGLGGVLTIDDQFAAESWAVGASSAVSNVAFGVAALAALALVAGVVALRSRRVAVGRRG